jgi:hypothetical protein
MRRIAHLSFLLCFFVPYLSAYGEEWTVRHGPLQIEAPSPVGKSAKSEQLLRIRFQKNPSFASHFLLHNPPRLVLDFRDILIAKGIVLSAPKGLRSYVTQVRIGRHPEKARIVLDLASPQVEATLGEVRKGYLEIQFVKTELRVPSDRVPTGILKISRQGQSSSKRPSRPYAERIKVREPEVLSARHTEGRTERKRSLSPTRVGELLQEVERLKFSLDRVHVHFKNGDRIVQDLSLRNTSTAPLYLTSTAVALNHAGTRRERRLPTKRLLVSPKRVRLEPGEERTVRFLLQKEDRDQEAVFVVSFLPDSDSFEEQFLRLSGGDEGQRYHLRTGMTVLVTAEPNNIVRRLQWERQRDALVFMNEGNVSLELLDAPGMFLCHAVYLPS